jgi:glycosyltransferase involved in cell wall biosynthesis
MCELGSAELARVVAWSDPDRDRGHIAFGLDAGIVVPWFSHVALLEVPRLELCPALVALARSSGNEVDVIGYDAIPLVSADLVPRLESERFGWYLAIVKHARRVLAISDAAAEEFAGFVDAARVQGLPGPEVSAIPLPVDVPVRGVERAVADPPYLLCVGSHDPRKNHERIIEAARILGREGHRPRLVFVGSGSARAMRRFGAEILAARADGVVVTAPTSVDDTGLARLYGGARATLFPSLHEGFGLPIAESLAYGVPVLTSDYGSMREVAGGGGCILVDPRDLVGLADGMRRLITDDELLARLEGEIGGRSHRDWDAYAADLAAALGIEGRS